MGLLFAGLPEVTHKFLRQSTFLPLVYREGVLYNHR